MPRRRNCYDNAVMKGFFSTVKSELGECFDNHGKANAELSDDFKVLYSHRRRRSSSTRMSRGVGAKIYAA